MFLAVFFFENLSEKIAKTYQLEHWYINFAVFDMSLIITADTNQLTELQ